jgi:hypothetical protein
MGEVTFTESGLECVGNVADKTNVSKIEHAVAR